MASADHAPKLRTFVEGRNAAGATRNSSLDDFKVPVPKTSANKKAARAGGSNTGANSQAQIADLSRQDIPRTLHDTDASFTTSTAGSTRRAHSAGNHNRRFEEKVEFREIPEEELHPERFETDSDQGEEDEEDGDQGLPEQPRREPNAMQPTAAHGRAPHSVQVKPDGRGLGRISGDTYPETTSGQPSTTHTDDRHEVQTAAYSHTHSAHPTIMPERGAGTRLSYASQSMTGLPHIQNGQQGQGHHVPQQARPPPSRPEDLLNAVKSGFSYGKAGPNNMQPNKAQPAQPPLTQYQPTPHMPTNTIHRGPATTTNQVAVKDERRQEHAQHIAPNLQHAALAPLHQDTSKLQFEGAQGFGTPEPQPPRPRTQQQEFRRSCDNMHPAQTIEAPESEMMSEFGDQNTNMPRESSIERQHEAHEPALLDHFPPQLYGMNYNELKAASFDTDPNAANPVALGALQTADTLPKKLDILLTMDLQAKREYFQSLGIEEWEEAGDWFLEQFAKFTGEFKIARREKRKIAQDFEKEIEQRHDSVSKKQKLTHGAMKEMKESGGKVLQGTPKKGATMVK